MKILGNVIMFDRLEKLEENYTQLEKFKESVSLNDVLQNKTDEWALGYGLFESIQIIIDISCHLVSKYNLGNPKTYIDCIDLLVQNNYLDSKLGEKLNGMIGLRNILIHEYVKIDLDKLYQLLNSINDFKEFAVSVKDKI